MNFKKSIANALKKAAETSVSRNTVSIQGYGVEKMPESLKKSR